MTSGIDNDIERDIAKALEPLEAQRRPFISMVGVPQMPAADPPPEPSQAQEEPILTLTERLQLLETQNAELRQIMNYRCDSLALLITEGVEAKLNAILAILK